MSPGQRTPILPDRAGVVQLVCDIHSHMRAFVVVSDSPWFAVCGADGRFRIPEVPEGLYRLRVWHEMGEQLVREVRVEEPALDLGVLELKGSASAGRVVLAEAAQPWGRVIDHIGMKLAAGLNSASGSSGLAQARKLLDDAYFGEFEASQMEAAVRMYLGYQRAGALEAEFRAVRADLAGVASGQLSPAKTADRVRGLVVGLAKAGDELNRLGIVDGSKIDFAAPIAASSIPGAASADRASLLARLEGAFQRVAALAGQGQADEALSALTDVYFETFEPIENALHARGSGAVPSLEAQFNMLRGQVGAGLRGPQLTAALASFRDETASAFDHLDASSHGAFGTAFGASLITILREGVEVILLLTMLAALVTQTGERRYRVALRWGVALALLASLLTALALKLLFAATQGRAQEILEGAVLLVASGLLFYVSYWLISRSEARRWSEFLKRHARQGAAMGSVWTIGMAAFLAVYREGAETALMYHGMFGLQATRQGELGVVAGLLVGLGLLVLVYLGLRSASVRLPIQAFFKVSGLVLFAMAVVFAGKAVFDLQNGGVIRMTPLPWLGTGLPLFGLYPSVQVVAVQGLLLAGALLSLPVIWLGAPSQKAVRPKAGAGVSSPSTVKAGA
jgi:high-affinity iron transporter